MPRGSRPGERRGGRKAGTPNKLTVARRALQQLKEAGGIDGYEHFLLVLNDPRAPAKRRDYAAAQLLPYTRPRLSPVVNAPQTNVLDTAAQVREALRQMDELTAAPPPPEEKPAASAPKQEAQSPTPKKTNGSAEPATTPPPTAQRGLPIKPKRAAAG